MTEDKKDRLARKYSDKELFTRLVGYMRPHWKIFSVGLLTMAASTLFAIVQPILLMIIIDDYILEFKKTGLFFGTALYFLATLFSFLLSVVASYFTMITGLDIITKIRQDTFYQLQHLSLDYYSKESSGRIISRVTNDVERLLNMLSTGFIDAIINGMFLVALFIILFLLDVTLALTVVLIFPILAVFIIYFRIKTRLAWQNTRRTLAKVTGSYQESISGIKVSKAFVAEDFLQREFEELNLENMRARIKALGLFAFLFPVMDVIVAIGTAAILYVGGSNISTGSLSIGTLVAFLSYLGRLASPLMTLSTFYNQFLSSMASTERIFDILDRKPSVISKNNVVLDNMKGKIVFENVSFTYSKDESSEKVLNNINLEINPKETVALVGHTGAGKTTITNLLCRFYDFNEGTIFIDDIDIKDLDIRSYRDKMSIIPQDSFLFSGTILDNLLYGNPSATTDEIEKALLRVGAYDFVLNHGLENDVGERGSKLSVGERQLLCFVRAILCDPKVIILDEATSSVDAHTELVIQQSLQNILRNRTAIIIAHRLSTVKTADKIAVLDMGEIKELGTFEELLSKKGIFADLYEKQFAGYEI